MKRLRLAVVLAALSLASTATAQTKIAVCDVRRAMLQTEEGMKAAASLQRFMKSRQADLDRRQRDLQKEQEDLRKQSRILSARALQRRTEHWQQRMLEVQNRMLEYNKEIAEREQKLTAPIQQKLFAAIRKAAARKGVEMVIDRVAVPYSLGDLDITDMVIQIYNAGGGDGAGEAKAEKKPDDAKGE